MAKKVTKAEKSFQRVLIEQLVTLSTSGFGFVAALAWNEAVQALVKEYIDTYFPSQSGVISKLIYALFITLLGVIITYQLSRLSTKFASKK